MAELLKRAGYATCCIGKWHLGDQAEFLPTRQGFDHYFGIPYSDDMTPREDRAHWPPLPLMRGEEVIEAPVDRDLLTKRCNEEAVTWIRNHKDKPFFLYYPETMPGSTRAPFASPAFKGKSKNGPWGDSVEELDWSLGQIVKVLEEEGIAEKTLLLWTSDNGAPRRNPPQGSNGPLAGWGYSVQEGGMRVPLIATWPGVIPGGTESDRLLGAIDLLPTFAALAQAPLPENSIDGQALADFFKAEPPANGRAHHLYFYRDQLQAIRDTEWKYYLPLTERVGTLKGQAKGNQEPKLYKISDDPGEERDLLADNKEVAAKLQKLAEDQEAQIRADLRPVGRNEEPVPLRK